jgi:hypothetical protein
MPEFRKLGYIDYNGAIRVHEMLFNVTVEVPRDNDDKQ